MNTQPREKAIASSTGRELEVHSIFRTIQGEGPFTGYPAIFIRLAGCNLQCPGCDTEYTQGRQRQTLEQIYEVLVSAECKGPRLVVITGGEPFRQNISPLANVLVKAGFMVQVESNGTLPPSKDLSDDVVIVCSPKTGNVNPKMYTRANCFKYVMHADSVDPIDGLPILALDHSARPKVARPRPGARVYLQPMDVKNIAQNHRNMVAVRDSCIQNGYILQLQLHKIIGVE